MAKTTKKTLARVARKKRVRKKISGSQERPRLSIYRSAKHIYAQVINDVDGKTVAFASTLSKELKGKKYERGKKGAAKGVGELIAKKCLDAGVKSTIFDRGGYKFHGRVKELAEGAKGAGLRF